jgi:hypothetical protein
MVGIKTAFISLLTILINNELVPKLPLNLLPFELKQWAVNYVITPLIVWIVVEIIQGVYNFLFKRLDVEHGPERGF